MTISRRRFLTISAGLAAAPQTAAAERWQGRAFGADISITLQGNERAGIALRAARQVIREIEGLFSLYDAKSPLVRLNQTGEMLNPDARFLEVMDAADHAFRVTNGLFDATVQRLWQAHAEGRKPHEYFDTIGWDRVRYDVNRITLDRRQALTFNGIAQGYATDKVVEVLEDHGLGDVLVNIGEHRSIGGPWTLGLQDPMFGRLGTRTLTTGAIATSSPMATDLIQGGHILHVTRRPQWSTVSVEARSATLADSLSTAMVLATRGEIEAIAEHIEVSRVTLINKDGDLLTV